VHLVDATANLKITTPDDLAMEKRCSERDDCGLRIGNGYDLHRLVAAGRSFRRPSHSVRKGLEGHSERCGVSRITARFSGPGRRHRPPLSDTDPA